MVQAQVQSRAQRQASPERWQAALTRALAEHVTVRQVNANGMWVATSGTDTAMAYLLEVTGNVAHSCTCPAGQFNDPVCKHRARWYFDAGLLDLDPEPEPPAGGVPVSCWACNGCGQQWYRGGYALPCSTCGGTGVAALAAQADALLAAAA